MKFRLKSRTQNILSHNVCLVEIHCFYFEGPSLFKQTRTGYLGPFLALIRSAKFRAFSGL